MSEGDSTLGNRNRSLQDPAAPGSQQSQMPGTGGTHMVVHSQSPQAIALRHYRLVRATQIIWLITSVLEALFTIRVLLKLMAANPAAGFAVFIYNMTSVFLAPFFGLTATPSANGSVLELFTLVAMLVYALLAWGVVRVIWIIFEKPNVQ